MKKIINIIIGLLLLLAIWQTLILIGRHDSALFPSPFMVFSGIIEILRDGTLINHIRVSLLRFLAGYITASISAIILGLILGRYKIVWNIIDPAIQILRPISPLAWFPFIVLWFGIGDLPAIVIIYIAAFFPVLLSTISGVNKVDETYLKVAYNFGVKVPQLIYKIILPAAFPLITNGLHIALGSAWVFLVAGEMIGAQSGLGYLIIDARNSFRTDLVLAGIIIIGLCGLLLDRLITIFEKWVEKYWGIARRNK